MYQEENDPARQVTTYVIDLHQNQIRYEIGIMPLVARLQINILLILQAQKKVWDQECVTGIYAES